MSTATGFNSSGALGTVKSVGLTMPDAFTVDNSPITESGVIEVTLEGTASQYVRGDGQLAQLPTISGGGGGQVYYLNGGASQGTIGGSAFKQLSPAATIGSGVDFTSTTADNNDFVNFITDIGTPDQETVPAGVWIFQCYLSSTASTSKVYAEVQVWDGASFTTLGTSIAETITNGTTIDLYTFTVAIPEYNPLVPADRIAIRFYSLNLLGVNTITLHTQNSHLGSIQTTFTTGLSSLNGLTKAAQYLSVGTAGTDFAISSATDTHTFNLPTASATNRGALSSTDWSTFNGKQNTISLTTTGTSGAATLVGSTLNVPNYASVPVIPQANKIYVDSINGTNSTGRGNINTPYLTVEYALADITNTGTITATTTNLSATLTAVSSTANIVVGQFITGTGIPYNSVVVSKTVSTIVLSQACTAGATITATWWTIYELMLNGTFVWVSNWYKQGFFINAQTSIISFSGVLLSPTSPVVPIVFKGGFLYGTSTLSKFLSINGASVVKVFLNPTTYSSSGTGYQIDCNQNGSSKFDSLYLLCDSFLANFGTIADIESFGASTIKGNYYGLLGGIRLRYASIFFDGDLNCPTSVNAFTSVTSGYLFTNGRITGNLSIQSCGAIVNSTVNGTAHSLGSTDVSLLQSFNGKIFGTVSAQGACVFNAIVHGNVTVTGGSSNFAAGLSTLNSTTSISISVSNAKVIAIGISTSTVNGIGNITLTNSSTLDVLDNVIGVAYTTYSAFPSISVDATSTLNLYKTNFGNITSCAGTINVYGTFSHINKSADITGTLNNKNGTIQLLRISTESATNTPVLSVSTGTVILQGGILKCDLATSKSGLIRKTANGGKIILLEQPYLKVANGLAPLQILSNTGTAQDVLNFGVLSNGAAGFRLANTFSDTTYGTAYAPNILGGGTNYEDTTYSF